MDLKNKKIAVIGAGIEGISTVNYLSKKGAEVFLLDKKNKSEIDKETLAKIYELSVKTGFGKNYLNSLSSFDVIFRSPGVRPDLPQLSEAKDFGVEVTSQTKLFFDLCNAPIVGVTGTKGKGTTSTLIYEILKSAGKKPFLGGNIGNPPLDFIERVTSDSIVVLELSSFQLIDLEKSPHIAVVLMVTSEHLDWHENTKEYIKAKESVIKYQDEDDFVVINRDYANSKRLGERSKATKYYLSTKEKVDKGAYIDHDFIVSVTDGWTTIASVDEIQIPGTHNLQNIAAAVAVAGVLEVPSEKVAQAVKSFRGLPHRLEFVARVDGVAYYNDSASTIPETTVAAINAFKEPKVVILGGASKHSDFAGLGEKIVKSNVKAVILIGEEAEKIRKAILSVGEFSGRIIEGLTNMEDIIQKAKKLSKPGDVVLLSPACASFGMFKNYLDRGDQFKEAIKPLYK
ncbi:MAG: UDP-N-acetylmuramoylalanine--D-glutamate ligase [Candidatus Woykebacteria bacterium RBG_16_43_9]|uniref:UDP-N-acetylmuramoylalanine--D-glutamate ligase n=1 Tax=Candidatus Woykebacteria bacterium RBG_16_43_9 TaxID=1802596 RepID=A0A1G1WGP4_9BACT|nr:MAG: UDP-N-acetylmuramoylalanine--D-glutamate ligase [Candidatus Woykebacteria bacterium RBG_16_43_9]